MTQSIQVCERKETPIVIEGKTKMVPTDALRWDHPVYGAWDKEKYTKTIAVIVNGTRTMVPVVDLRRDHPVYGSVMYGLNPMALPGYTVDQVREHPEMEFFLFK